MAPGNARFERFRDVVLTEFLAHNVEMIDCVFSGTFKKSAGRRPPPLEREVLQSGFVDGASSP